MPEVRNDKEFLDLHGLERFWNNVTNYLDTSAFTVPAGKQVASVRQDHGKVVVTFEAFGGATGAAKEAARESLGVSSSEEVDEALAGKADLVDEAVEGNLAALDAEGNLVDSGVDPETLKRVQEAWSAEPDSALYTLGSIGQDANGVVSVTFVRIPDATVSSSGLMSSGDKGKLDGLPDDTELDGLLAGKADKVENPVPGNLAGLDSGGNLADSGYGIVDDVADPVTHAIDYETFRDSVPTGNAVEQVVDDKVSGEISGLNLADKIDFDNTPRYIKTLSQSAGQLAYTVAPFDETPQANSDAPVTSEGIHLKFVAIETLIPSAASGSNQLADKEYVDSLGERIEARYLGSDANGNPFPTYQAFVAAQRNNGFYYNGARVTPNNNDVIVVTSDDTHLYPPGDEHGTPTTTRYHYQGDPGNGQWCFEYVINNSALNRDQLLAVNSGITPAKVQNYDAHLVDHNNPHQVTKAQVGLGNVDNTADADKPISNLTQAALDTKVDKLTGQHQAGNLIVVGSSSDAIADSEAYINDYYAPEDHGNPETGSAVKQAIRALSPVNNDPNPSAASDNFVTSVELVEVSDSSDPKYKTDYLKINRARPTISNIDGLADALSAIDTGKADKKVPGTAGNLATLDVTGNLGDSGVSYTDLQGEFKSKQTAQTVSPVSSTNSLTFLTSFGQDANGEIVDATAATVPDATVANASTGASAVKGVVSLSSATDSTSETEAATPKAVKDAYDRSGTLVSGLNADVTGTSTNVDVEVVESAGRITGVNVTDRTSSAISTAIGGLDAEVDSIGGTNVQVKVTEVDGVITGVNVTDNTDIAISDAISEAIGGLDSEKTSSDGTNVQVKVTQTDGKITAVNVTTDNTENRSNKVSSFQAEPDDTHYPSEKLVKDSLDLKANKSEMVIAAVSGDSTKKNIQLKEGTSQNVLVAHQDISGKADKVNNATDGHFAGLDSNGNLTDSGHGHSDYASAEQGGKADTALQGAKIEGSSTNLPVSDNIVTIPLAVATGETGATDGLMTEEDKAKLDDLPSESELETLLDGKADKAVPSAAGNLATLSATGNLVDSRAAITSTYDSTDSANPVTGSAVASAISGKADKDTDAVEGNFASFDANGNPVDSGSKASDFATAGHTHGNITNDGRVGETADLAVVTTTGGSVTTADMTVADVSASGSTLAAVTKVTQASNGKITVEKKNLQEGTTSQKGVVQLSSTAGSDEDKAATPKLVSDSVSGKADKVSSATAGNFAGLDSEGNLTDSGKKASDFAAVGHVHGNITNDGKIGSTSGLGVVTGTSGLIETKDFSTSSPETGVGTTTEFIDTVSQGTDGEITATKKAITHASTSAAGIVSLSSDTASTSETEAATPLAVKTVKDAVDGLGNNKADKVSSATNGNFAGLDASGNLTDSGKTASDFATSAQGTKADSAIQGVKVDGTALTPDANKVVSIPDASTSAKGTVQLSSATDSTSETAAATPKAVKLAYDRAGELLAGLDNTETSTDGTNVQVKVTQVDGAITAVNVTTDNTENRGNKVTSWSSTTTDAHYPSEKLVKGSLDEKANKSEMSVTPGTGADSDKTTITLKTGTSATVLTTHQDISGKADKVSGATSGNFAGLDTNGNITDSGSKAADFATASQGGKADTAVQDVKIGNTSLVTDNVASLPDATTLVKGVVQLTDSHTSTSTTTAATPKNVKEAYDLAAGKAAKVSGATSGNLASLDSSGDLVDSGIAANNVKTKQAAVNDPDASGTTITAIDTISQNANGEITATKKTIRSGTTSQTGVVKLSDAVNSTSTSLAATANAVKKAYDHADSLVNSLDVSSVGGAGKYISAISETDGKISATETTMDTTPTDNSTNAVTSGGVKAALDVLADRISGMGFEIVDLTTGADPHPDVTNPSVNKIYLTKDSGSTAEDPYTEWIYIAPVAPATVGTWQVIGETSMDLSGYKTVQTAVSDPTASGTTLTAIDTISQNANGEITATKKTIPDGTTSQKGVVTLTDSHTSTSITTAATPKSVKEAYDLAAGKAAKVSGATEGNFAALDANGDLTDSGKKASDFKTVQSAVSDPTASGNALSFIDTISQNTNGVLTATKKTIQSASGTQDGVMSSSHYTKLEGISTGANKVEASTTNGNIKIDGTETTVYTHPTDGANTSKGDTTNQTPAFGSTFKVTSETVDAMGHTTVLAEHTVKIPNATAVASSGGTGGSAGLMSAADKEKLNGIATGAEVNQNAFSNVKVGTATVAADAKTDTIELATTSGKHIVLTADTANDKVTIDTDLSSKSAASGGTAESLVTTGEKYTWNSKASGTHTHGNITNDGKIGSTDDLAVVTGTSGAVTTADLTTASPSVPSSGTTTSLSFIDTVSQDSKGKITATKKTVLVDSTYSPTGTDPVNGKAVAAAISGLDAEETSTDGTNVQVKVTETAGKVSAVNVTTDNTENRNNKVSAWSATTTDTHYPTEKLVKDSLDGKVDKVEGKGLSTEDYTNTEKTKLAGIATGAEVNQNAFSNVKVGSTTVSADSKTDTLELASSSAITLSPDATNDKVTIGVSTMGAASSSAAGTAGIVPAPGAGKQESFLRGDGTWVVPTNTDTLVKATAKTDNVNYKILATASASPTSGNATEAVYDADITLNPSTNTIAANISGNAATATKPKTTTLTTSNNLDDIKGSSLGDVLYYSWTSGNAPTGATLITGSGDAPTATMEVIRTHSGNYAIQTVYTASKGVYRREYINDTWGAWYSYSNTTHTHGNITSAGALQTTDVAIASGDKLVITDSSDSNKVARSSTSFDGSTTTTALTPKGTFEAFAKAADITNAVNALDYADTAVSHQFVTEVDETNGVISVSRSQPVITDVDGLQDALDAKVNVKNISLESKTTTILAQVKALNPNTDYARFYTGTDGGSANISDKPESGNKGFLCEAICSRRNPSNTGDYRYQLTCWVQNSTNPYVATVQNDTTAISWSRLNTQTITGVKGDSESSYRTGNVNLTPANLGISATSTSVTVGTTTFNQYVHPTTSGNKHVPSGGSSGQFLGWDSDGTAKWVNNPNTDTKVKATAKTDNVEYKILATASASPTSGNATEAVYDADITLNPSTNTIAANISGNAATATKPKYTLLTSTDDLNNAVGSVHGDVMWYQWASGSAPANVPTTGTSEMEVVRMHDGNYCTQTVYVANNETVYRRINKNGTWGSWYSYSKSNHGHGNIQNSGALQTTDITVASGDKLVVTDASDSNKVARTSISFDGSTETTALTPKGTWVSFVRSDAEVSYSGGSGIDVTGSGTTRTISLNVSSIPEATIKSLIAGLR